MKRVAVLSVLCWALEAHSGNAPVASVTAVRHWSLGEVTRIAVEVSGDFHYRSDRLHNPERIYFDIVNARNGLGTRYYAEDVSDAVVKRIRVAEANPGITRVVIDLTGDARATTTQLANPGRLIIELRSAAAPAPATTPTKLYVPEPEFRKPDLPKPPITIRAGPAAAPPVAAPAPERSGLAVASPPSQPNPPAAVKADDLAPAAKDASTLPDTTASEVGKAARRTASGETSLIRALGLKLNRVVIDPGHGGHDEGTAGAKGLLEKDLVLDIALRAGALIEERLRAEVIYTRSTDVFIPLESRTALANEKKADLFISIHANASSVPKVSGVETYFLNFTEAKDALAVAARENASSIENISELHDLIQKITLHDKAEESKDLAGSIQSSLFALYSHGFPGEHDRGVRRAPFVVLIGATMPSVLAEIGFLSNPKEEALLRRPDYRQKVAEALVRGVEHYAAGLSHFQVAQNK
ncbi:MAG: N-acetylmuramoyl-L-alanine amidase [Bryobacteraceae bacterium]|jgi:N-acetylmuramoyl-L-alanine amidase